MSNIPKARRLLEAFIMTVRLTPKEKRHLRYIVKLTRRRRYVRVATRRREKIDPAMKRRIRMLVANTDMTMHEIANKVGLRSSGRVSEVVHGKR